MTIKNLTLNNWKEQFNSFYLETISEDDSTKRWHSKLEKFFSKLLSLQHQKDIEQFKNMESMRHQSFACKDDCDDKICIKIKTQNQKIDEILKELKTL